MVPLLLSIGISFVLSALFFSRKISLIKATLFSIPTIFIYYGYYIIRPIFLYPDRFDEVTYIIMVIIPISVLIFLVNGLAIWLGSWIHAGHDKQKN